MALNLKCLEVDVDGGAADSNDTVEAVVLAANGLGIAKDRDQLSLHSQIVANSPGSTRADTNNTDGRASDANGDVDTAEDNTQETEEGGDRGVIRGLDAVAALDGANDNGIREIDCKGMD